MEKYSLEHARQQYGILPDWAIRHLIKIRPFAEGEKRHATISYGLSSYGYDVRLDSDYKIFSNASAANKADNSGIIDPKKIDPAVFVNHRGTSCVIPPNSYALCGTLEEFELPRDVLAIVMGKSTYARCGLIVNVTPGEPEWVGRWTMELSNSTPLPIKVHSYEGIAQILFLRAMTPCQISYADKKGKYQNQAGLTLPTVDRRGIHHIGQEKSEGYVAAIHMAHPSLDGSPWCGSNRKIRPLLAVRPEEVTCGKCLGMINKGKGQDVNPTSPIPAERGEEDREVQGPGTSG